MSPQLSSLLANFWREGDLDSPRVLADKLQELPAAEVAEALVHFRTVVSAGQALGEVGKVAFESAAAAFRAFAEALPSLLPDEDTNSPP